MHVPKSYVSQAARGILVACLLALPVGAVHGWMAYAFPYYTLVTALPNLLFALLAGLLFVQLRKARPVGRATVPLLSLLYLGWLLVVVAEAISYYLQGESFNDRFFAHLDPTNLSTGLHAFPLAIGGALFVVVLVPVAAGLLLKRYVPRTRATGAMHKVLQVIVTLALVAPLCVLDSAPGRLARYFTSYERSLTLPDDPQAKAVERNLNTHPVPKARVKAVAGKNVVFIYMESLERTYVDPQVFPGLTPNLAELRREGIDFSGLETFSGASYTIAGIFASQCGVPLFSSPFAAFDYVGGNNTGKETFHPQMACLGDVLHAAGYTQTFLGGAPGSFANKSLFFQLHGYDSVLGKEEIEAEYHGKLPQEGWGLYDENLFDVAFKHYEELAKQGGPFNLTLLTLDTHPPHGRPSPGCPKYGANADTELQAVHCTDFLVGRFIARLKQTPAWNDTVVLVMSDHRSMRSTAARFYPPDYHRQPLLFVLNGGGQGVRATRMYHMDIAPTLLAMMGVRTNARFLAGADRSAPRAPGNPLEDGPLVRAVLRKSLWSMNKPVELCRAGALMEATEQAEFSVGGRPLDWLVLGTPRVALDTERAIAMLINDRNASLVEVKQSSLQPLLDRRPDSSSAIVITPSDSVAADGNRFSVDWLGRSGAKAHIASVPRLRGLQISSSRCKQLIAQADAAKPGTRLDLAKEFVARTANPHPVLKWPVDIDFRTDASRKVEQELGWFPASSWGSWTVGSRATLGFTLPPDHCRGKVARFTVHPFLPPSRSQLDVDVSVNGKLAARWNFKAPMDSATVAVPLDVDANDCKAQITMQFARPGSKGPPYPKGEDPREFQLSVLRFRVGDAAEDRTP